MIGQGMCGGLRWWQQEQQRLFWGMPLLRLRHWGLLLLPPLCCLLLLLLLPLLLRLYCWGLGILLFSS